MNATTLAAAISTAMDTAMTSLNPLSAAGLKPYHDAMITAIAVAVVSHIQAHAVVAPGTFAVAAAPGVVAGNGSVS